MIVGVLREPSFESRVSLLAEAVGTLKKKKVTVCVEAGAGERAYCPDADYEKAGALVRPRDEVLEVSDLLLGMHFDDIPASLQNKMLVGVYQPLVNTRLMAAWASRDITCFSLDMLPRTTRAQGMDVLSSQANIAGYKAVLVAANLFPRYFPMFMTAAGSIPPREC